MAWRAIGRSSLGVSHYKVGKPCQDAVSFDRADELLIGAVSDGAGSAHESQVGAKIAVSKTVQNLKTWAEEYGITSTNEKSKDKLEKILDKLFHDSLNHVLASLKTEANQRQCKLDDFACTLIAFVSTPNWIMAMQVGDGFIVVNNKDKGYKLLFEPDKGEYPNQTSFITSLNGDYSREVKTEFIYRKQEFIFASTDGLERVAIQLKGWTPHKAFFEPFKQYIKSEKNIAEDKSYIDNILTSRDLNSRIDDDKSVLLCYYHKNISPKDKYSNYYEVLTPPELPPSQLPPSQLPPSQLPPSQLPPSQLPPSQLPPSQLPPSQLPPSQLPPSQLPPSQLPPSQLPPSQLPPSQLPPSQLPPSQLPPSQLPPNTNTPKSPAISTSRYQEYPSQQPQGVMNLSGDEQQASQYPEGKSPTHRKKKYKKFYFVAQTFINGALSGLLIGFLFFNLVYGPSSTVIHLSTYVLTFLLLLYLLIKVSFNITWLRNIILFTCFLSPILIYGTLPIWAFLKKAIINSQAVSVTHYNIPYIPINTVLFILIPLFISVVIGINSSIAVISFPEEIRSSNKNFTTILLIVISYALGFLLGWAPFFIIL